MIYTIERWGRFDVEPVRYSAELDTRRGISTTNFEQFMREVRPVWGLVNHLFIQFKTRQPHQIGTMLGTDVNLMVQKYDMEGPLRVSVHVEGGSKVVQEGTADILMAEVSEWAKAQSALLPKSEQPVLIQDNAEPPGLVGVTTATDGILPRIRLAGSIAVGALFGLSSMSVYVYGWSSGPSVLLLTILGAVLVAIFTHRFGWNR